MFLTQNLGGKGRRTGAVLSTSRLHSEFKARMGYRDCLNKNNKKPKKIFPRPCSCFLTQGS